MRILVISQYFWPENFRLNDLCLELTNRGHTVEVLTGIPNYPKGKYYKGYTFFNNRQQYWNGIKIHRTFLTPRGRNSKLLLILNYFTFLINIEITRKYLPFLRNIIIITPTPNRILEFYSNDN